MINFELLAKVYSYVPFVCMVPHVAICKQFYVTLNSVEMWHMLLVRDCKSYCGDLQSAALLCPTLTQCKLAYRDMIRITCVNCKQPFQLSQVHRAGMCIYHPMEMIEAADDELYSLGHWECCGEESMAKCCLIV